MKISNDQNTMKEHFFKTGGKGRGPNQVRFI